MKVNYFKFIKLLMISLLFSVSIVHAEGFTKKYNNGFYLFQGEEASSACNRNIPANPEPDRLYTTACLHCSGFSAAYQGCVQYSKRTWDSGWGSTPIATHHNNCKYPVVQYRTQKGEKTNEYRRCNTYEDGIHEHCVVIEGNACATCARNCDPYDCNCDENGNCQTCYRRKFGYKCMGVDANGGVKSRSCVCGCSECYQRNEKWKKEVSKNPRFVIKRWIGGAIAGAVNAGCTTEYRTKYEIETCTKGGIKITPNVCQTRYKMKPSGSSYIVDAFCVNPDFKPSTGVQWDQTFDATTCATSASTRNCGFANILIEGFLRSETGKYNGMDSYAIISYALQIWGAHSNEGGYIGSGFSPESNLMEASVERGGNLNIPPLPDQVSSGNLGFGIQIDDTDYTNDNGNSYYTNYLEFVDKNGKTTGDYKNIFRETGDNFNKYYLNAADIYHVQSDIDVRLQGSGNNKSLSVVSYRKNGLKAVDCNTLKGNGDTGFCGVENNKTEYLEALYLYANTVQGNPKMQEHLNDLIWLHDPNIAIDDLGKSNNPESIVTSIDTDTGYLTITYKMANQGKNMKCAANSEVNNVKVCCKAGDPECNFTQNKITIINGAYGYVFNNPPKRYDYCLNGYCYLKINLRGSGMPDDQLNNFCEGDATRKAIFDIKLAVLNTKSAIKRYESKDSPTDHQSYFLLDYSHSGGNNPDGPGYVTEIACDGCKDGVSVETGYVINEKQAKVLNDSYTPEKACTQFNEAATYDKETGICYVRIDSDDNRKKIPSIQNKCINCIVDSHGTCLTNNGITMVDNSINAKKISDPSLNCIVNMSYTANNLGKSYYEYSNQFGVNEDVCRIYCSDEVNIYLANKRDVYVGMHLQYNIENIVQDAYNLKNNVTGRGTIFNADNNSRYYGEGGRNSNTNEGLMLSAIILQERKCVSKIYYNNNHFDSSKDWATKYGLGGSITNWKELYNALRTKAGGERDRRENLNQLIYDLYNCNLLNSSEISSHSGNAISKPVDRVNVYEEMINFYKTSADEAKTITATSSTESISDHRCGDTSRPCSELNGASYKGGAEYIPNHLINNHKRVGISKGEPSISYYTTSNADLTGVAKPITVSYCYKSECFKGQNDYVDDYYEKATTNPDYKSVSSQVGDNKFFGGVEIPTKDYAVFTIQVRTDYYNSEIYQTEHYTGRVKTYDEDDNAKYVKLDKFLYPVSLDAFQDTTCNAPGEDGLEQQGRCQTNFAFTVKPFVWRKVSIDRFSQYLSSGNSNGSTSYVCSYVSRPNPARDGIVYRSIKLNDPFPNDNNETRPVPTNWMTTLGKLTVKDIKNSANDINTVTDKYLEYKYTFTKQALDNIRDNYNFEKDVSGVGYSDVESLQNCKKAYPDTYTNTPDFHSEENGTIYVECESTFLDLLNGYQGVTVHKGDGISKCTMDPACR